MKIKAKIGIFGVVAAVLILAAVVFFNGQENKLVQFFLIMRFNRYKIIGVLYEGWRCKSGQN
jgi:hypothetical protein